MLITNNVQLLSKEMQPTFMSSDIRNIRRLSRNKVYYFIDPDPAMDE